MHSSGTYGTSGFLVVLDEASFQRECASRRHCWWRADRQDAEELRHADVEATLAAMDAEGGELAARNLLGQRAAGPARELAAAAAAYRRHKLHWAEAALTLSQRTDYEVPFLQRQMAKCSQQLEDLTRKEAETKRGVAACRESHRVRCTELGITGGHDVRAELRELPVGLAPLFQAAVDGIRSAGVVEAVTCYQDFVTFAHKYSEPPLPLLHEIQQASVRPRCCGSAAPSRSVAVRADGQKRRVLTLAGSGAGVVGCCVERQEQISQMGREALERLIMSRGGCRNAAAATAPQIDWSDLGGDDVTADGGGADGAIVEIDWDLGGAAEVGETDQCRQSPKFYALSSPSTLQTLECAQMSVRF